MEMDMKHKRLLLHSAILLLVTGQALADAPAQSSSAARASVFLGIQDYYWDEQDPEGILGAPGQLVEENGYLFELGIGYDNYSLRKPGLIYSINTGIATGNVEYDGQLQSNDPVDDGRPITTDVEYFSWDTEGNLGYRFQPTNALFLDLIAGIGYDFWRRDLQPTSIPTGPNVGESVQGSTEYFNLLYSRLTGGLFIPGKRWDNRFRFGARWPLYIEETVDQLPGLTLEPKMQMSPFAEWQLEYKGNAEKVRLGLSVYFEETYFEQSDFVPYGTELKYQPESNRREMGLRLKYFF